MKERPILFSAPMVRAILDGSKTQTRRVVKPQPSEQWAPHSYGEVHKIREDGEFVMRNGSPVVIGFGPSNWDGDEAYACPYGQPGDRLWVREAFRHIDFTHIDGIYSCATQYEADKAIGKRKSGGIEIMDFRIGLRPSIHMPRWASRIDLEITGVRVERLQDISEEDALAEGIARPEDMSDATLEALDVYTKGAERSAFNALNHPIRQYRRLWESINGPGSWDANPWVWVIEFRRIKP